MSVIDCEHARDSGRRGVVVCALGKYGGRPHVAVCRSCLSAGPGRRKQQATRLQACMLCNRADCIVRQLIDRYPCLSAATRQIARMRTCPLGRWPVDDG